jgi:predicted AAA+ superfamily ATPase
MNLFKIVLSESLLGINSNGNFLDPGPTIKHIEMTPMDFEEFLCAVRREDIDKVIQAIKKDILKGYIINETLHNTMNSDIKDYIIVGGMPQVVLEYTTSKDLGKVYQRQEGILSLYRSDIQQYQSTQDNKMKTLNCFDSI